MCIRGSTEIAARCASAPYGVLQVANYLVRVEPNVNDACRRVHVMLVVGNLLNWVTPPLHSCMHSATQSPHACFPDGTCERVCSNPGAFRVRISHHADLSLLHTLRA